MVVGAALGGSVGEEPHNEGAERGETGAQDADALFDLWPGHGADAGVGVVFEVFGVVGDDAHDGGDADALKGNCQLSCRRSRARRWVGFSKWDLQSAEKEDAAQFKSLPDWDAKPPYHWDWQTEDEDIENQIADAVPAEECHKIDTSSG